MKDNLVGRDAEIGVVSRFLEHGTGAVVVEGEAGIGKTALWEAALEIAAALGRRVLSARPAEAETAFSFAALGDLLRGAVDAVLPELPEPQRYALEVALLVRTAAEAPPDPYAVSVAATTALELLARDRPVLVAVDDMQWVDSPSRVVVEYAARRAPHAVAFLLARRDDDGDPASTSAPLGTQLRLEPLTAGALHQLIHDELGIALARPTLLRVHATSGGNPFYALELARALGPPDAPLDAGQPLPVPASLRALVAARVAALAPETRDALVTVAAATRPTRELVPDGALADAAAAGVVVVEGDAVRFVHPLVGSVVYADAPAAVRRAAHRALAASAADAEEAARHRARAAAGPDAAAAAAAVEAAAAARARGAPTAAAELLELAANLTPDALAEERDARLAAAARFLVGAGDPRARDLLHELLPRTTGNARANALYLLGLAVSAAEGPAAAVPLLEDSLADVRDGVLEAQIHIALSGALFEGERIVESSAHAARAVELAEAAGDAPTLADALVTRAHLRFVLLEGIQTADLERAEALGGGGPGTARLTGALDRLATGDVAAAAETLERLRAEAAAAGSALEYRATHLLAYCQCRLGNAARAKALARQVVALALASHNRAAEAAGLFELGLASIQLGDVDDAVAAADQAIAVAAAAGASSYEIEARWLRGHVALVSGDASAAYEHLAPAIDRILRAGFHEPCAFLPMFQDATTVLAELGRPGGAAPLLEWLERDVTNPWAQAAAAYCRGVLAAAAGDEETALSELHDSAARFAALPLPVEHARALLALGAAQRRARRKREARRTLEHALAIFERVDAPLWADAARAELRRIGGRRGAGDELTESERRVAALVAAGRSNKEIAAALFISPKTVEGHLSNVYAKLGVRSRTELARKVPV